MEMEMEMGSIQTRDGGCPTASGSRYLPGIYSYSALQYSTCKKRPSTARRYWTCCSASRTQDVEMLGSEYRSDRDLREE